MTELLGLILSGGESRRMQRDKASLCIDGETQLARAYRLVAGRCSESFVSIRPGQCDDPVRRPFPQVVDRHGGIGPLDGILSAMRERADGAWLVVACDLPLLTGAVLDMLIAGRDAARPATAFRSAHDGLPEPLCAIYEPDGYRLWRRYADDGGRCPRKMLIDSDARLLAPPPGDALANVNTPDDLAQLRLQAAGS